MTALLSLQGVGFRNLHTNECGGDEWLFEQVKWSIQPGEHWAVIGAEGCGKSTLMRLMAGLMPPHKGHIVFNGQPYSSLKNRAEKVAVLFQEPSMRFLTPVVWEEVGLTLRHKNTSKSVLNISVDQALTAAGLSPNMKGRSLTTLSASQRARVAWASVLVNENENHPRLILADEPGSQLSDSGEKNMGQSMLNLKKTASVIFSSRIERGRRFAHRLLSLTGGKLQDVSDV